MVTAGLGDAARSGARRSGGTVVRVSLAPEQAKAAIACEVGALDDEFRRFVVPLELLKDAYVALFTEKR